VAREIFAEPGMVAITVWARGVYENKEARDVTVVLTEAAKKEGKYIQSWENYVDLPDRIYVPVRAYGKISPNPITTIYVYENLEPNIVALTEETLVKGVNVIEGIQPGAVLVINTKRSWDQLQKYLDKDAMKNLAKVVLIDANKLAKSIITLSGAEGTTDASGIGKGMGAALAAAIVKGTDVVDIENVYEVVGNKNAAKKAYEQAEVIEL
jgi:Pyruvate/2-oxoacid:ferredoxin oxidoreductase gamma subunit